MPTLLQINVVANFGSTGRIADEIGEIAMANGWESYIAFGREKRPSKSNLIRIGNDFDLAMHVVKSRMLDRHGFGSKLATLNFINKIQEIKPDIIQLHNIHGYYINIDVLFKFLSNLDIPIIWTLHDCWSFTGHCAYFDFIGCDKWIDGCYSCPQKKAYPSSIWKDNSLQNYLDKQKLFNSVRRLTIVPVSNWLEELVKKSYLKNKKTQVINNGINLDNFYPKENNTDIRIKFGVKDCFMLLGVASSWGKRKGLDDFIKLSNLINKDIIIVLVGVDKSQIESLPSNIIGIERTENVSQLAEIYSAADLYLNLTYEDNFPTTNLEALACGTPVLTYNTGGSIEAVSIDTGFIVEKGDVKGIENAIDQIKMRGKEFYSNSCVERVNEYYNKNDRFRDYLDLYNSEINQLK